MIDFDGIYEMKFQEKLTPENVVEELLKMRMLFRRMEDADNRFEFAMGTGELRRYIRALELAAACVSYMRDQTRRKGGNGE